MWTPDVYEGAQTPVTGFMAAATKVAALVVTLRLLVTAFPDDADLWTVAIAVIVCISLAWGNLAAIVQTGVKRMLAYSSISHAGFLLMAIAAGNDLGGTALLYYFVPYAAMSVGAFAVVAIRERELAAPVTLGNLAGFGWERPWLGGSMALFMFGFIGLPPTGIFLGKLYVFSAVIDRGWTWLAIVGVVFTAVSVYYYAGVVRAMYMQPRELAVVASGGSPPRDLLLGGVVAAAAVVAVGTFIAAGPLLDVARDAVAFLPFPES
jgi:NADH-quinone oxidoreductase subunit N